MWLEPTKQGLKIHENDKHIKTVPIRYEPVITRITFSDDGIRLSTHDRLFLEAELFRDELKKSLTRAERLVAERIEGHIVEDCIQIDLPEGHWENKKFIHKKRFVLLWSNKDQLTCSAKLFKYGSGEVQKKIY
jgi:hypothetical protein